jgi:predicted nucleic acid-binding protein
MVLVDSCIWIEAAKRQGDLLVKLALEALLTEGVAAFCGPVKLEVLGAVRQERRDSFSRRMNIVPYIPMPETLWDEAVRLSWRLRDTGLTVPWNDILIANLGLSRELRVYSIDGHFQKISTATGLVLYQPGYGGKFNPG